MKSSASTGASAASGWAGVLESSTGRKVVSVQERKLASLWAGYGCVVGLDVTLAEADADGSTRLQLPHSTWARQGCLAGREVLVAGVERSGS